MKRFKDREDWTPGEILEHKRTGKKPERSEYREARQAALEDAGLEPEADDSDTPVAEMTAAQHLKRIRSRR